MERVGKGDLEGESVGQDKRVVPFGGRQALRDWNPLRLCGTMLWYLTRTCLHKLLSCRNQWKNIGPS